MKTRTAATASCVVIAACIVGAANAQTWPQLTAADLEACRPVIAQAHQKEFAFIETNSADYCSPNGKWQSAESCKSQRDWLAETKAKDDVAWYFKGNGHCEASDYPCFGPEFFNDARTGAEATRWSQRFAEMAAEGVTITSNMEFYDAAEKADNCAAGLWVKKFKAGGAVVTPVARPAPPPAPAAASTRIAASDPAFQSNLKNFGADQLLALTSELLQTGEIDLAKLARNALLARFPDSPLVPVVVQLITEAAKSGATPAPAPAPSTTPVSTANSPANGRFFISGPAELVAAFSRVGIGTQRVGTTNEVRDNGNAFSAYPSNCVDGRCHAIQLLARYALEPLPANDRVQSWNTNKLYGRSYLSGKFVCFDMVATIPSSGIDDKTLQEAVALFKDAASAFYKEMTKP
jgi:hypothetical protein